MSTKFRGLHKWTNILVLGKSCKYCKWEIWGYGCDVRRVGVGAGWQSNGIVSFFVKTTSQYFFSAMQPEVFTADIWWHILQTWTEQYGIVVYLNGVRSGDEQRMALPYTYSSVGTTFRMGRGHGGTGGRATIDEFLFWPEARGEDFAEFVYNMY